MELDFEALLDFCLLLSGNFFVDLVHLLLSVVVFGCSGSSVFGCSSGRWIEGS